MSERLVLASEPGSADARSWAAWLRGHFPASPFTRAATVLERERPRFRTRLGACSAVRSAIATVDIEPHLYPLIEVLIAEAEGGRLMVPPIEDCAELLRQDLWTVGVRRPELHHGDATRTPMTFHCLRDTCLTHMAVRGDSPIAIQWRAGHSDFKMTQSYISRGKVEARRIGEPLPLPPPEVLVSDFRKLSQYCESRSAKKIPEHLPFVATPTGIEFGNGDSRKLSAGAVLADNSRESLEEPLPLGPVGFRRVPRVGAESRQPDGNQNGWARRGHVRLL